MMAPWDSERAKRTYTHPAVRPVYTVPQRACVFRFEATHPAHADRPWFICQSAHPGLQPRRTPSPLKEARLPNLTGRLGTRGCLLPPVCSSGFSCTSPSNSTSRDVV